MNKRKTAKKVTLGTKGSLKRKTVVASTEAAAISIGIHILLIVFAGSIVALQYVQKQKSLIEGSNISRPKLERRQLQMPVKVQNLQKKSRRPKVATRMATAGPTSFALPDMMGMGGLGGGFDHGTSAGGRRSLSTMGAAGSLGFGVSGVNFFGAKGKGEKVVFIIEADKDMMTDARGGFNTYRYVKKKLSEMIEGLSSATLFNVMFYTQGHTVMFRPKPVPATPENREAVTEWYSKVNETPKSVGSLDGMGAGEATFYTPRIKYEDSRIGDNISSWMRPVQAAMEMKADNIFVLCSGWGLHIASDELREKLYGVKFPDHSEWLKKKGWTKEKQAEYDAEWARIKPLAQEAMRKENEARKAKGLPPKIGNDDLKGYAAKMGLKLPPKPKSMSWELPDKKHRPIELTKHLNVVYEYNYKPNKLRKPTVHFVKLIAEDGKAYSTEGSDQSVKKRERAYNSLLKMSKEFGGNLELLRGAKRVEDLIKYNESE